MIPSFYINGSILYKLLVSALALFALINIVYHSISIWLHNSPYFILASALFIEIQVVSRLLLLQIMFQQATSSMHYLAYMYMLFISVNSVNVQDKFPEDLLGQRVCVIVILMIICKLFPIEITPFYKATNNNILGH